MADIAADEDLFKNVLYAFLTKKVESEASNA
jgi:hypothetical protein